MSGNGTRFNRRDVLKSGVAAAPIVLAGCTGGGGGEDGGGGGSDGGGGDGGSTTPSGPPSFENEAGAPVGESWEAVQELAQEEEGQLTLYGSVDTEDMNIWLENWDKDYIDLNFVTGDGQKLASRAVQEFRAGSPQMDIPFGGTATTVLMEEDLAMELSGDFLPAYGREEVPTTPYLIGQRLKSGALFYNTEMTSKDAIAEWTDILAEKWAGKVGWDPTPKWGIMAAFIDLKGEEFFEGMKEQDMVWTDSHTDLVNFCAQGKYPLSHSFADKIIEVEGQSVAIMDQLTMPTSASGIGIAKFATNPNQALVFAHYLSSEPGQEQMAKTHQSVMFGMDGVPDEEWTLSEPALDPNEILGAKQVWEDLKLGAFGAL